MRILAAAVLALTQLLAVGQEFNYEQEGIEDFASNDTRALCVSMLVPALVATGHLEPNTEPDFSTMMINAHTARAEGINCFINLDGALFHLFFSVNGERIEGIVVRYTLDSLNRFAL